MLSDKERIFGNEISENNIIKQHNNKRRKLVLDSESEAVLRESKLLQEPVPKENRSILSQHHESRQKYPLTQPFILESADEDGTIQLGNLDGSKKKRFGKQGEKAFSYKKIEFDGIRRSERIKDKGGMTESDCY